MHPAIRPSGNSRHQPLEKLDDLRVLIVEDAWIVAASLQSLLEMIGASVVGPCTSLDEATAAVRSGGFDVAVMDLDLQGEMSDELIGIIADSGLPVVVVSGNPVQDATAQRVAAVLPKPYRAERLLQALREVQAGMRGEGARMPVSEPASENV